MSDDSKKGIGGLGGLHLNIPGVADLQRQTREHEAKMREMMPQGSTPTDTLKNSVDELTAAIKELTATIKSQSK